MIRTFKRLEKLCVHTITNKPWGLEEALENYCRKGVKGISVWQNAVEEMGAVAAGELLKSYPIEVVSYVRGGFFPSTSPSERQKSINNNVKLIEQASAINAPLLVLVCGADPSQSLEKSRDQIRYGIEALLPKAEELGIKLGIEPLHPVYADTRSAINTVKQANDLAEKFNSEWVGVVIDVYHVWWDDQLQVEIKRCGRNKNIFAYHICDWKIDTQDILYDRGIMGEGCIPLLQIGNWIREAGFDGFQEVEIFSNLYWKSDQSVFLDKIIESFTINL